MNKKKIGAAAAALMLMFGSFAGTLAYLKDTDAETNVFTVGKVQITMDEEEVNLYGEDETPDEEIRVMGNDYKLIPKRKYIKDPTIHIDKSSSSSYVFVKVENGISKYEDSSNTIAMQIADNGWTLVEGTTDVYYKEYTKGQEETDYVVFREFKIANNADKIEGWSDINPETTKIDVTGYAVQKEGFATAKDAWNATFYEEEPQAITKESELKEAAKNGGSYYLASNITLTNWVMVEKDLTLDLNGKRIDAGYYSIYHYSQGCSTIKDSKGTGAIIGNLSSSGVIYVYYGELIVDGGTIIPAKGMRGICAMYDSKVTINGGTINGGSFGCIQLFENANATINGGTFINEVDKWVVNSGTGTVVKNGGTFKTN